LPVFVAPLSGDQAQQVEVQHWYERQRLKEMRMLKDNADVIKSISSLIQE